MNVTFSNVLRSRPLVLTDHEVWSLSRVVGRDVLPELQAICAERYEVMTLGQLMRTLTATLSSQRQHIGSADCPVSQCPIRLGPNVLVTGPPQAVRCT